MSKPKTQRQRAKRKSAVVSSELVLPVHLAKHCVFAGIITWCGAGSQGGDGHWTNRVNFWGRTGIVKFKKLDVLAFNQKHATCSECLQRWRQNIILGQQPPDSNERK